MVINDGLSTSIIAYLIQLLKEPTDWERTPYTLTHNCGVTLWVSNGWKHLEVTKPEIVVFSEEEKWRLWQHVDALVTYLQQQSKMKVLAVLADKATTLVATAGESKSSPAEATNKGM